MSGGRSVKFRYKIFNLIILINYFVIKKKTEKKYLFRVFNYCFIYSSEHKTIFFFFIIIFIAHKNRFFNSVLDIKTAV